MKKLPLFLIFFIVYLQMSFCQVVNDQAKFAIKLPLEKEWTSKTDDCTVESHCVDESLTGKCVEYHNDQWFSFNSGSASELFINIFNQNCRDTRGVQLIVFKGTLCEPESYQILTCISTATQDDIHTHLEGLEKNQHYWLIIDGYLHDYCRFTIEVSRHPKGFSMDKNIDLVTEKHSGKEIFTLRWQSTDSLSNRLVGYSVYRKKAIQSKFVKIDDIGLQRDAYGRFKHFYTYRDTLQSPGTYQYLLVAEELDGALIKIAKYQHNYSKPDKYRIVSEPINLRLRYPVGNPISIKVYNENAQLIDEMNFEFNPNEHHQIKLDKLAYINQGVKRITVYLKDLKNQHQSEYFFRLVEAVE